MGISEIKSSHWIHRVCVCVVGFLRENKSRNHDKRSEMILSAAF